MKQLKYLFFLPASIVLIAISCSPNNSAANGGSTTEGNWIRSAEFSGNARTQAISFVIGDTAYVGTGFDGTNRYNDLWSFDPVKMNWQEKANLGDITNARSSAVAWSIGTKGYVATGTNPYNGGNGGPQYLHDTWQYDQATNTWKKMADLVDQTDLTDTGRYEAVAFAIGNYGYVCSGFNGSYQKDLWQFDPNNGPLGTWTQKTGLTGYKRQSAVAFVYNNQGYVVTGINNGSVTTVNDFWKYDPPTDTWTQLRNITNTSTDTYDDDYTDITRYDAVAFVMASSNDTTAYLAVGDNGSYTSNTWAYSFKTDLWSRRTPYERSQRAGAVSFVVDGRGFVALGSNATYYFDDMDEFNPTQAYNSND